MNDNKTHSLIAFSDFAIYNDGNLFITMCNFSKVILISMNQQEGFWTFRIGFALYRHIIYFHADAGNLWPAVWLPYLFQRRYMLYLKCDKKVHQLRCVFYGVPFFSDVKSYRIIISVCIVRKDTCFFFIKKFIAQNLECGHSGSSSSLRVAIFVYRTSSTVYEATTM